MKNRHESKTGHEAFCTEENFVGNRRPTCLDLVGYDNKTLREKFLIGAPRACFAGTAEEMEREGFVGLYSRPKSGKIDATRKTFSQRYLVSDDSRADRK